MRSEERQLKRAVFFLYTIKSKNTKKKLKKYFYIHYKIKKIYIKYFLYKQ